MYQNRQESKKSYFSLRKKGRIALILVILLAIVSSKQTLLFSTDIQNSRFTTIPSNQVFHESIEIASDNDFILQGWPGNGSVSNPFLIEELEIRSDDECIRISNTRSHFVIRNCFLSSILRQYHGTGVYLRNVTHGTIELSKISGLGVGIYDRRSTKNVYRNNTIEDTWDGILLGSCIDNIVANNSVTGNQGGYDIHVLDSRECSVLGNFISGIVFAFSTNCTAGCNSGLVEGLNIYSENLTHWLHRIYDNYFNGNMLGYFRDTSDSIIDGNLYSQLILVNVTRAIVSGGVFRYLSMGVQIIHSADCKLSDIVSERSLQAGVNIKSSINCTIINSSMNENSDGVLVSGSERIRVEGTKLNNNSFYGIGVDTSNSCHFIGNTISNNWLGISINMSNNCTISENDIFENDKGIVLSSSNQSLITNNVVHKNEIGILLETTTSNNSIYWNTFIWNTEKNAVDDGTFNSWDDGISRGNVWSDYAGCGPYTIPGLAQSVDRFPMAIGFQIPNVVIPVLLIIITTIVLLYSQKQRFRELKSSKN